MAVTADEILAWLRTLAPAVATNTTEIAKRFGMPTRSALRRLHKLLAAGVVEWFDDEGNGLGRAIYWRAVPRDEEGNAL